MLELGNASALHTACMDSDFLAVKELLTSYNINSKDNVSHE